MNKSQLIEVISNNADITKVDAGIAIDTFIKAITGALKSGDSVTLIGLGSFSTVKRAARVGRNPKTGKEIKIPSKVVPKFKSGKALKEIIAGKVKFKPAAKVVKAKVVTSAKKVVKTTKPAVKKAVSVTKPAVKKAVKVTKKK